jgi:hypothetical protein
VLGLFLYIDIQRVVLYIFVVLSDEYRRQQRREKKQRYKQWLRDRGYTGVGGKQRKNATEDAWMDYVRANYDAPVGVEVAYTITNDFWTLPIANVKKTTPKRKVRSNEVKVAHVPEVRCPIKEKLPVLQTSSRLSILRAAWKKLGARAA